MQCYVGAVQEHIGVVLSCQWVLLSDLLRHSMLLWLDHYTSSPFYTASSPPFSTLYFPELNTDGLLQLHALLLYAVSGS